MQHKIDIQGKATILTYGVSRDDSNLAAGVGSVLEGTHSGHAGILLEITPKQYDKYIRGYARDVVGATAREEIPSTRVVAPDGSVGYLVEINFSSIGDFTPNTAETKFVSNLDASLAASTLAAAHADKKKADAIGYKFDSRSVYGHLPVLRHFAHQIMLEPMSTVHLSLIPKSMRNGRSDDEIIRIIAKFQAKLSNARRAIIATNNDQAAYTLYLKTVHNSVHALKNDLCLDHVIMDDAQFLYELSKFAAIGTVPHEYYVPLSNPARDIKGFSMDDMLKFYRDKYDNREHGDYNLFTHNCSHFIREMLCASTSDPTVHKALSAKYTLLGHVADDVLASKRSGIISDVYTPVMLAKALSKINSHNERLNTYLSQNRLRNMPSYRGAKTLSKSYTEGKCKRQKSSPNPESRTKPRLNRT